jgi:DNA repair ATPase RecN
VGKSTKRLQIILNFNFYTMSENVEQNVEQKAPLKITISEVKELLNQGKSRKEIAEHFGRTQLEMKKMVWSHPKLKNLKAKKQYTGIELEDDTDEVVSVQENFEVEETQVPVSQMEAVEEDAPADALWK